MIMTQETSNFKRTYAIIELGIDSGKLAYFEDDHPEIWYDSDIYWFKAKADMTDDEYSEYMFTIKDLAKHYGSVYVCSKHAIIRFTESDTFAEMVDSVAFRGTSVRFGAEQTKVILNPMTTPYKSPYEDDDEEKTYNC